MEFIKEAQALTLGRKPTQHVERDGRQVDIWEVEALDFSEGYGAKVRVVKVRETWIQRKRIAKQWIHQAQEQNWMWVVAGNLTLYAGADIRDIGHLRWKVENNAFGELTQHWHLTHSAHHHPTALLSLLWIKLIAFTLFHAFAILHGKRFRLGTVTLAEIRRQIYRSLLCGQPLLLFSG